MSDLSHKNVTAQSIYRSAFLEVHPSTQPGETLVYPINTDKKSIKS